MQVHFSPDFAAQQDSETNRFVVKIGKVLHHLVIWDRCIDI